MFVQTNILVMCNPQVPKGRNCKHLIIEPHIVNDYLTNLVCISCGQITGCWVNEEITDQVYGVVRPLTDDEKEELK